MNLLNNIIEKVCCLLMATSFLCLSSCDKGNDISINTPIEIYDQFPPYITPMDTSSIIAISGAMAKHIVVNSLQELHDNIPSQILHDNPKYQKIDFNSSSLIIIKFRLLYKPQKIDYKIFTENSKDYKILQTLTVENTLITDGFFVMSCVVTEKISNNSPITLVQAFYYI